MFAAAAMVLVVAFSLIDAGWTGDAAKVGFLPWVGLTGLMFGILGAKVGWGRWRTHAVGALFAGLVLPLIMGGIVIGQGVGWDPLSLAYRLAAAVDVVRHVWTDLVVNGRSITTEIAHYYLVFGTLVWGAGMLAGFTVFGHRRPLDAIVVLGLVLLANMALTDHDQLFLLEAFSAASLLLLIRSHVFDEEVTWARRKIGDPAAVGQLYMNGGAMFVIGAVLGAILLTATASSVGANQPRRQAAIAKAVGVRAADIVSAAVAIAGARLAFRLAAGQIAVTRQVRAADGLAIGGVAGLAQPRAGHADPCARVGASRAPEACGDTTQGDSGRALEDAAPARALGHQFCEIIKPFVGHSPHSSMSSRHHTPIRHTQTPMHCPDTVHNTAFWQAVNEL